MLNPTRIVISRDPKFYEGRPVEYRKNAEFCTSAAIISASNSPHVVLSEHLLSFLLTTASLLINSVAKQLDRQTDRQKTTVSHTAQFCHIGA